jgi:CysZ protein
MSQVFFALVKSMASFGRPGLWRYLFLPPLITCVLWLLASFLWLGMLTDWLLAATPLAVLQGWLVDWHLAWIATSVAFVGAWIILLAAAYLLAAVITGIWALPRIAQVIAAGEYPDVAPRGNDSVLLSIGVTVKAVLLFLLGWLLTLPVWVIPGMAIVHSFFWLAYLNRKTFAYDALAAHVTSDEWKRLQEQHGGPLWMLGLFAAVLAHFPLLGFFAPVFAATAFVHFGLTALRVERGARGDALDGEFQRVASDRLEG